MSPHIVASNAPEEPGPSPAKGNELEELVLADKYGVPDHYLSAQKDTLWYHWLGDIFVKPIRFEAKTGTYVIALKSEKDADLGKHRHRGPVTGYTVKGSWGYKERVGPFILLFKCELYHF